MTTAAPSDAPAAPIPSGEPVRPALKRARDRAFAIAVRGLIVASHAVPRRTWMAFCGLLGRMAFHLMAKPRKTALDNLARVYGGTMRPGEIRKLAIASFAMMGRNGGDTLRSVAIDSLDRLARIVDLRGADHLARAHAKGKGVVLIAAHVGAFELLAPQIGLLGYEPHILGTPLANASLNRLLLSKRGSRGSVVIERGKDTRKLLRVLKEGGVVAFLIDQDTKVKSRFVEFLGAPAATPVGPTLMAMKTGAAVVPIFIHLREDGMHQIDVHPEIPLRLTGDEEADLIHNTRLFNEAIERTILAHPEQWVWIHRRWRTKPGEEMR